MTDEDLEKLDEAIAKAEGWRSKPYLDTKKLWTVGYGTNYHYGLDFTILHALFSSRDLDPVQGWAMVHAEYGKAEADLVRTLPWIMTLDPVRYRAFVELTYNMGIGNAEKGLLSFSKHTLPAARRGDWQTVVNNLRASKWTADVGPIRSNRVIAMLLTGKD